MVDPVPVLDANRGSIRDWWRSLSKPHRTIFGLLAVGVEAAAAAFVGLLLHDRAAPAAVVTTAIGTLLMVTAVWFSCSVPRLANTWFLPRPDTTRGRPDRGWTQYKAFSFGTQAVMSIAVVAVFVAPFWGVDPRVHLLIAFILVASVPVLLLHGLTYPLSRPEGPAEIRRGLGFGLLASGGILALTAAGVALSGRPLTEAAPLLLAAAACCAGGYNVLHRPPTPRDAWLDDAVLWPGRPGLTVLHRVGVPAAAALGASFVVLFLVLLLHVGTGWQGHATLLFPLVLLACLSGGAAFVALRWWRTPDIPDAWRVQAPPSETTTRLVLSATIGVGVLLVIAALLVALDRTPLTPTRWIDVLAVAVLVSTGPFGFLAARRAKRVRMLEARFPDFLRDLAAGREAGLTLEASVRMATKGDYGELTPEIRRLSAELAWNRSFEDALAQFAHRVRTPLVRRAVSLITEASRSGGHVVAVLQAAAEDARHRKDLQDTRGGHMRVYMGIVYIGFLVFLGVAAVLYATLIPRLVEVSAAFASQDTPQMSGLTVTTGVKLSDYRTFYFVAAVAQAIGNGLFAGLIGTGRLSAGLQHVFFMVAAAAMVFLAFGGT